MAKKEIEKITQKQRVINEFAKIPGIGKAKAVLLYKGGFESLKKLKKSR